MFGRFSKQPKVFLFWTAFFFAFSSLIYCGPAVAAENSAPGLITSGSQALTHPLERKVISPGGYGRLVLKARNQNKIRVIVQIFVPLTPELFLIEQENQKQQAAIALVQGRVLADLGRKGRSLLDTHAFKYTPHLSMTVDTETLNDLLESPDVDNIQEDIPFPPTLNLSVPRIGATTMHASGLNGTGVTVAILDTGVDKNHPFLTNSVLSEACYSSNSPAYGSSSVCPGGVAESTATGSAMPYGGNCPAGECSHGTHVAGIAAGNSGVSGSPGPGVAPGAGIIAIQVFSRFNSEADCGVGWAPCVMAWTSDIMKGLQRVYDLRSTFTIVSVNLSLGGGASNTNCDSDPEKPIIDNLRAAGIATIISSGNNGYCGYISSPACISSAISVGATDDADQVAIYSNSAPFMSLLAPGSLINSSVPGGGYQSWSGTSMASPHVTGAWALMKEANPSATVNQILNAFSSTGLTVADSKCLSVAKKRINVNEADNALTVDVPPTVTTGSATSVTQISATLNGTVNPNGLSTTYYYQWGTTASYGNTTSIQSAGSGSGNIHVTADLTGLSSSTTYHYRVVATNSSGTRNGSDLAFTTLGPPSAVPLISPSGTMALASPTFYWYAVSNATEYHLYIDDSTGNRVDQWVAAAGVNCGSGTGTCSFTPSLTLAQGAGSWMVQARNSYGDGPWSSNLGFVIDSAGTGKVDFNSDGKTDILWRNNSNGTIAAWYMDGVMLINGVTVANFPYLDWEIQGIGDFNNDGKPDILWRNKVNGTVAVWYMNGVTMTSGVVVANFPYLDWEIQGIGDFNNDGKPDILWRNKVNGTVAVWYMNGVTMTSGVVVANFPYLDWEIQGTGDFNNDGKTDILWRNKVNGTVAVWYMNGVTMTSGVVVANFPYLDWEIQGTGDFNNDGKTDILWRHKSNGTVAVWYMNGVTLINGIVVADFPYLDWEIINP